MNLNVALRADIERLPAGLVVAMRDAAGQIKGIKVPKAPTNFKIP